jgi:hypothetical protein
MSLETELSQFTGTESWRRHHFNPLLLWTDGVEYFAEKANAYWFIDLVAIGAYGKEGPFSALRSQKEPFGVLFLHSKDGLGLVEVFDDVPGRCLFQLSLDYTDCPEGVWKFYLIDDGEHVVLLLPSEY